MYHTTLNLLLTIWFIPVIISICWFAGCMVGLLPMMGWHQGKSGNVDCFFLSVMDYNYLVFLYFGTIITPALILAAFYAHIYRVILQQVCTNHFSGQMVNALALILKPLHLLQLKQIVVMNPDKAGGKKCKNLPASGMIRMLGVQQRNDVKATQNLAIIVLFFMICWIPLYTINCIIAFRKDFPVNSTFMLSCIILSHLNSAGNPLLYAYHLRDFRAALKTFFCDLLGIQQKYCDHFPPRQPSNFSHYRSKYKESFNSPRRVMSANKCRQVEAIVKNPIVVATVPAAGMDKTIWNIAEDSGRDSGGSSQDSFKDIDESSHRDTLLMLRSNTPFKSNIFKANAECFSISKSDENYSKNNDKETSLNTFKVRHNSTGEINQKSASNVDKSYSKSSPQLSKAIFVIEPGGTESKRQNLDNVSKLQKNNLKLSSYRLVSSLLSRNRTLNRSLSDSGSMKKRNGITTDSCSVQM